MYISSKERSNSKYAIGNSFHLRTNRIGSILHHILDIPLALFWHIDEWSQSCLVTLKICVTKHDWLHPFGHPKTWKRWRSHAYLKWTQKVLNMKANHRQEIILYVYLISEALIILKQLDSSTEWLIHSKFFSWSHDPKWNIGNLLCASTVHIAGKGVGKTIFCMVSLFHSLFSYASYHFGNWINSVTCKWWSRKLERLKLNK